MAGASKTSFKTLSLPLAFALFAAGKSVLYDGNRKRLLCGVGTNNEYSTCPRPRLTRTHPRTRNNHIPTNGPRPRRGPTSVAVSGPGRAPASRSDTWSTAWLMWLVSTSLCLWSGPLSPVGHKGAGRRRVRFRMRCEAHVALRYLGAHPGLLLFFAFCRHSGIF